MRPDDLPPTPRAHLRRLLWPLAALPPVLGAAAQLLTGVAVNLPHDLAFLLMVGLAAALDRRRAPLGSVVFLLLLAPFMVWLTRSPGVGALYIRDLVGYGEGLVLPTALVAVRFRYREVVLFGLYVLLVGVLSFSPEPGEALGVLWNSALGVGLGSLLTWLLDGADDAVARLGRSALVDALTGLGNRRAFDAALDDAWARAPGEVGVILLDVDGLKTVNDTRGHAAGDELLGLFARSLQGGLPPGARAFRLGGDEYVVLCPARDLPAVRGELAAAVGRVRELGFPEADASVGCARGSEVGSLGALVRLADERMYAQKRGKPHRQGR